jgi:hypothetical protein
MSIFIERTEVADDDLPMVLFKDNMSGSTLTASTTATGYYVDNLKTGSTYDTWQPTSVTSHITVDMGSPTTVDCLAISAHNLGTVGTHVTLQYSSDGASWSNVSDETLTPIDVAPTTDDTLLILLTSETKRYWRVGFQIAIPTVGVIQLGERLTFPHGVSPSYVPLWQSQNVELLNSRSMTGQFLGNRVVRRGGDGQINLVPFEHSTLVSTDVQLFKTHYDNGKPFVFAAYPSVFDKDLGYCWRKQGAELRPTFQDDGTYLTISLDVETFVN